MKKFLFLAVCLAVMTSAINAQSEGWKGVKATYNNFEFEDADAISSFSVGYVQGFKILKSLPVFVEGGANAIYTAGDIAEGVKYTSFAAEIPVNIGYKFNIDDNISLFPFVGVTARYNITGEIEDGEDADKFQHGWQIGLTANYANYNLGVSYGADLNEIYEETKTTSIKISVGYNF